MNKKNIKDLVFNNILLLIPLVLYAVFKNGYLIYEKGLIRKLLIFKPIYFVLISVIIKLIVDLIRYKKIKFDYDLVVLILVSMIIPYNINIIVFSISLLILYLLSIFLERIIKFNKVCFIYLLLIIICLITNTFEFKTILESSYIYSFSFLDLLMGRNIGGISSTSILFSLIAYSIFLTNYYYKKDIPLFINISYLICIFIYFLIVKNSNLLINSELIFGSIFVSTLPISSPFNRNNQILYSIVIGILTALIAIFINSIIAIYLATFITSLFLNINIRKK